ncbi:MAG: hypothetical protein J1E39_07320 [Eubacterium sp.]|nr:hypothetical protein [Eubacterium sp.]
MLSGVCLFIFIFLGICGSVNALVALRELVLPAAHTVYIRASGCEDIEYKVRCALARGRGDVVVVFPESLKKNKEFTLICRGLLRDQPRVRLICTQRKGQ